MTGQTELGVIVWVLTKVLVDLAEFGGPRFKFEIAHRKLLFGTTFSSGSGKFGLLYLFVGGWSMGGIAETAVSLPNSPRPIIFDGEFGELGAGDDEIEQEPVKFGFFLEHGEVVAQL